MILHQPRGEDEVDRQIISMLYDAVVVGTISSGNYRRIFFGDNNKNGVAGNQEVTARSTFSIRTSHSRNCCAYISVQVKVPWRVYFHVYYHDFKQEIGIQGGIDYRSVFRVEDSTPMLKRPKSLQPKATATSEEQRSFNDIFERFRIVVFKKLSRNADLKKNNEILKSVFMNLYEMVNKTGDRPGLNLIEFKVSVYKIFPGFKLDEIRRLFLYFDTDRNGRITVEEFIIGIKVTHLHISTSFLSHFQSHHDLMRDISYNHEGKTERVQGATSTLCFPSFRYQREWTYRRK